MNRVVPSVSPQQPVFITGSSGRELECDSCPTRQLSAAREDAPTHDRIVHHNHGQAVVSMPFQLVSHKLARCEQVRLVCGIDSLHFDALPLQPLKVGRKRHECRINVRATYATGAAQWLVEDLDSSHFFSFSEFRFAIHQYFSKPRRFQ